MAEHIRTKTNKLEIIAMLFKSCRISFSKKLLFDSTSSSKLARLWAMAHRYLVVIKGVTFLYI